MKNEELRRLYVSIVKNLGKTTQHAQEFERFVRLLREQENTDPLTGLLNRRLFEEQGEILVCKAIDNGVTDVSSLLLDIDDFKEVNDKTGYQEVQGYAGGDLLLKAVARVLYRSTRPGDLVGRVGGDEFGVLLYAADREGAEIVADRIIRRMSLQVGHGVSIGLTAHKAPMTHEVTLERLMAEANLGLKYSKGTGKGKVGIYVPGIQLPGIESN